MVDKLLYESKVRQELVKELSQRVVTLKTYKQFDKSQEATDIASLISHFSFDKCEAKTPDELEVLTQRISLAITQYNLQDNYPEGEWYKTLTGDKSALEQNSDGSWAGGVKSDDSKSLFSVNLNIAEWGGNIKLYTNSLESAEKIRDHFLDQIAKAKVLTTQNEDLTNQLNSATVTLEGVQSELSKQTSRAEVAEALVKELKEKRANLKELSTADLNVLYTQVIAEISFRILGDNKTMVTGGVIQL